MKLHSFFSKTHYRYMIASSSLKPTAFGLNLVLICNFKSSINNSSDYLLTFSHNWYS